ncbi:MAG: hypothetical protein QG573_826 [Acidobacteriota bacterium]|nr:hypothetical protein [Acidobacteriota bacterium]
MLRSTRSLCPVWLSSLLVLLAVHPARGAAPTSAPAPDPVVVLLGLAFEGEVPAPVRQAMASRLGAGLTAARVKLVDQAAMLKAIAGRGTCHEPACWKSVAAALGCRYVVGGTVRGEDGSYEIRLFMGDAFGGAVVARVQQRCEICGLQAAADKIDLTASALVARLEAAARAPARVAVQTEPPGAMISVDGDEVGPSPREVELTPGPHQITAKAAGYAVATRSVTAVAGVQEKIELRLLHLGAGSSPARVLGWVSLAVSVAAIGAGLAVLSLHGSQTDCPSDVGAKVCLRETRPEGGVLVGLGAVAAGVGTFLVYRSRQPGDEPPATVAVRTPLRLSF